METNLLISFSVFMIISTIIILGVCNFRYIEKRTNVLKKELENMMELNKSIYSTLLINPCLEDYKNSEEYKTGDMVFYIDGVRGDKYILNLIRYDNTIGKDNMPLFNINPLIIGVYKNDKGKVIFTPLIESSMSNLIAYYKEYFDNNKKSKSDTENIVSISNLKLSKEVSEAEYRMWLLNSLKEEEANENNEFFNTKAYIVLRNISLSGCKYDKGIKEVIISSDIESYCREKYGENFSKLLKDFDEDFKKTFKK